MTNATISTPARGTLAGHLAIARLDHWSKNVFVLPGVVAALALNPTANTSGLASRFVLGVLSVCLISSSNYTLNEIVDAPFDLYHPDKRHRPVPSGRVNLPLGYLQWLVLAAAGAALGLKIGAAFSASVAALWVMGCGYNLRPLRTKDVPYLDVLTEAINNPLRLLAGWYIVDARVFPPATLLLSYWMVGCYFMAIKRFAECRQLGNGPQRSAYRRSLAFFTPERLLTTVMFYGAAAMLFFGAFIMRYRLDLIISFPLVALVMAMYLRLGFRPGSAAQHPEKLYREPALMVAVCVCALVMGLLLFVHVPLLDTVFPPTVPTADWTR
jgi:4-hydroxybenzoate polyprenyltransferase